MNKQASIILLEETNKSPVTDPKEMEVYKWPDKETKIIIFNKFYLRIQITKKFNKFYTIQENTNN